VGVQQPHPKVTEDDVQRIVHREFSEDEFETAMLFIRVADIPKENARTILACLKRADGNLDALLRQLETAEKDFRDVLLYAEYPQAAKIRTSDLNDEERQRIYDADWLQYSQWLYRE
jgi:hypothetical protein